MEAIESIFSTDNDIVKKLKEIASKPDYKKIFFAHLGPELKKIYLKKKDKLVIKNFLDAAQYEYGFFNKEIDLSKAFSLYKKYADLNDYFCMYKMHVIYLCEYEKFNVKFSRVYEKLYLLKCFAYLPNYVFDWYLKLFDTIDVIYELAAVLDIEDGSLEKHKLFIDLLNNEREKYNLTENDINLMRGVFSCYFYKEEEKDLNILSLILLNSLIQKNDQDLAYYNAKNKCAFFRSYLNFENIIPESDIDNFYKEIEQKKLYEFYADYGNYLIDKKHNANEEIIEIFKKGAENGYLFCCFRCYQCLIDFYDFDEIMADYDKIVTLLDFILDEIIFENIVLKQFINIIGFSIRFSNFNEKIFEKYYVYLKEIHSYISNLLYKKEKLGENIKEDEEYIFSISSLFFFFGFKSIETQNYFKAITYLDKANTITKEMNIKKSNEFYKYNIKKIMNNKKLISDEEFIKAKKDLIEFFSKNLKLKHQTIDCFIIGEDFFEGLTKKKDEYNAFLIYEFGQKIFCKTIVDCLFKSKIKKFLKNHQKKFENNLKDETCIICYDRKVDKIFIPCKHNFCSICINKLEKDSKCPICRSEIICIV